jgi:hypothetical protein
MYFADLSPYYYPVVGGQQLLMVGWLERGHAFPTGEVPAELVAKLRAIEQSPYPRQYSCALTRGLHYCHFCKGDDREASNAELFIPDADVPNRYYATTFLTSHYIEAHRYQPPEAFIRAVLAVDLHRPYDAIVVYDSLLLTPETMREEYEEKAKDAANMRVHPKSTEKQREYFLRGSHLRYRKWLDENPKEKDTHPSENSDAPVSTSPSRDG